MSGELNQKEVQQIQGICKEQGIVPVSNIPNEDLRLNELKRLNIMDKDLGQDPRFSSLSWGRGPRSRSARTRPRTNRRL